MPRPRGPSRPELTRRKVVDAAARLFGNDGYHDVSLARIASEAGITVPSVTYYFPNKQALFDEVLRMAWSELAEALRPLLASDGDPEEMLGRLFSALVAVEARDPRLFTSISAALLSNPGLGVQAVNDTLLPLIDEIEDHLRTAAGGRIDPRAPLRETLVYITVAHAAEHLLSRRLPTLASRTAAHEPFIVFSLLNAVMAWTPQSPPPWRPGQPNSDSPAEAARRKGSGMLRSAPTVNRIPAQQPIPGRVLRVPAGTDETDGDEEGAAEFMRARITEAAQRCFRRLGVAKTTVSEVAQEASLSRSTVYRYVPGGRAEIVLLVLVLESESRLAPLAESRTSSEASFADILTEGMATMVEAVREDTWLRMLFSAETFRLVMASDELAAAGHQAAQRFVAPYIDPARQRGEIRSDLTDADIAEWVNRVFLGLLAFETDTVRSPERLRHFVRTYAVTPLLA